MNLLDLALIAVTLLAAAGGYRLGFLARGLSWIGLGVGIFAATYTVPWLLRIVPAGDASARLLAGTAGLIVTVALITSVFETVGYRARGVAARRGLRPLDRSLGFVAGGLGILTLIWLVLPAAAEVPGAIARQVRNSAVVAWVQDAAPEPPDTVQALRSLVDRSRFPEVFAELGPTPELGPPPSEIPVPQEVVQQATGSTGNIEATGCGLVYEGSGFVVAPRTMITNAHVVAGAEEVQVLLPGRAERLPATVVVFDDDRDLAVLEVPELDRAPLPIAEAAPDTPAAVIGYPRGQDEPRVAPATIRRERTVTGRDIYRRDRTERQVLFLSAALRQGDSGAPVIDPSGNAVGAVFAVSPDRPDTAFALASTELRAVLDAERRPGFTGECQ